MASGITHEDLRLCLRRRLNMKATVPIASNATTPPTAPPTTAPTCDFDEVEVAEVTVGPFDTAVGDGMLEVGGVAGLSNSSPGKISGLSEEEKLLVS